MGPWLNPLSEFINHIQLVGQAPGCFLERSQKIQAPHKKHPRHGDGLDLLVQCVDLPCKVLALPTGSHNLSCISGGCRPVKTLPESLSIHAP
jgi:hypothetical protein